MNNLDTQKALIYCRVSSDRQAKEGHGLDSQEHRCRAYAESKGYEIEEVFRDSYSGGGDFMKRPAMVSLLKHTDKHAHIPYVVVFDDLSRLARDVVNHFKLRQEFGSRNIKIECPNFIFDDSPENELMEVVVAGQNQYFRRVNRRQVIQKQKARLEKGYWTNFPPPGYTMVKDAVHGKILVPIRPECDIIKEAIEGYANGRFHELIDVMEFLQEKDFRGGRRVHLSTVARLLTRIVYAGYVERPEWGVERRKGYHEAIISLETFEKVQDRLNHKPGLRKRRDMNPDFPIRGIVTCSMCKLPLTASWSSGRNMKIPYYRCRDKNCSERNKSIPKKIIEKQFLDLLKRIKPSDDLTNLVKIIATDIWQKKVKDADRIRNKLIKEIEANETGIAILMGRLTKTSDEGIATAYEDQIKMMRNANLLKREKVQDLGEKSKCFETAMERVMSVIGNPDNSWETGDFSQKIVVSRLIFEDKIAYNRKSGFETANLSVALKVFRAIEQSNLQDVEMLGIEPRCNRDLSDESTAVAKFEV